MKKYLLLAIFTLFCLCGCGKTNVTDAIDNFANKVNNSKSYKLIGTMEINNNDEVFTYSLESYHLKDDYYKVVLINQTNNHEQVILKNDDGLYVITPSLNKSFKFDSVWPENSSQAYLLGNLVTDLKNDASAQMEESDDGYIIKSAVDYPNNEELTYQKIYFDKDMTVQKVEVYNDSDIVKIKVNFTNVNLKAKLSEDDFALEDLIDEEEEKNDVNNQTNDEKTEESSKNCMSEDCDPKKEDCSTNNCDTKNSSALENVIYPLYIPANTYLSNSETVANEDTNRVILTFSGDKNFVIVEEAIKASNEFEIIPVYGDPLMLDETIGAISSNSLSWSVNNIDYYLVSTDLSTKEMISVASSLGNATTVASVK